VDEAGTDIHAQHFALNYLDFKNMAYPRCPAYTVFDETMRKQRPIATNDGWSSHFCLWSKDNLEEIKKGWIKRADTIAELGRQIGVDSKAFEATMNKYNGYCAAGCDPEFDRVPSTLEAIDTPPFYAIATVPALLNTQGGPKRNQHAQVVDVYGNPIKRLYSAGEFGSLFGTFYPGAGNISECVAFGRIAGRNAAAELECSGSPLRNPKPDFVAIGGEMQPEEMKSMVRPL
jgi:succinate dehydrogenase/fumarate reductase flavoprotein subunit